MDSRCINEHYAEIGMELIQNEETFANIKISNATIVFLSSQHKKNSNGRPVLGQCERIQEKYKWGIPCDFTITLFEPNLEGMTEEQIKIVIFHELLHVGIRFEADGSESYFIEPHDLEDFKIVIDKFGTNWSEKNES